eukprot:GGOE01024872.1.p1 GENE.GGOE01024872.1~~GGOE01024872.1.p1  ORF type:complete len:416 (-),score=88.47 GGOE01024872.1:109-1314(-)
MNDLINKLKGIMGVDIDMDGRNGGKAAIAPTMCHDAAHPLLPLSLYHLLPANQNCPDPLPQRGLARMPQQSKPAFPLQPTHVLPEAAGNDKGPAALTPTSPSCPNGAASEETSTKSSLEALWEALASGNSPQLLATASPLLPPERRHPLLSMIQFELQLLLEEFPAGTPPKALCQALAYLLYSKHGWQVKFCGQARGSPPSSCVPATWLDEVLAVTTPDGVSILVDVHFRDKFLMRCPTGVDEQQFANFLRLLPEVYIGLVDQLLLDVKWCTSALERIRQGTLPPWCCSRTLRTLYKMCLECDPTPASDCLCAIEARLSPIGPTFRGGAYNSPRDSVCCLDNAQLDSLAVVLSRSFALGGCIPYSPSRELPLEFEKEEPSVEDLSGVPPPGGISCLLTGSR